MPPNNSPILDRLTIFLFRKINFLLFLICLINGFFYIFFIPPWQKYDEPGHFEFAWLIANHNTLPTYSDFDWNLRRELVSSMREHNFYNDKVVPPNMLSTQDPPSIIYPQINDRPLYYLLVSIPLFFTRGSDIELQLYLARIISWILYFGTVSISRKIVSQVLYTNHILTLLLPICLALFPGFTHIMTSVNDDVGATFFFSLFLVACISIIKRGELKDILMGGILAIFCFFTKDTTLISFPLFIFSIILAKIKTSKGWKIFCIGMAIFLLSLFSFFHWGDAKNWLRTSYTIQNKPTSAFYENAPHGKHVMELVFSKDKPLSKLFQYSRIRSSDDIANITIGSYIWSTETDLSIVPFVILVDNQNSIPFSPIQINQKKNFYHFSFYIPKNKLVKVMINPLTNRPDKDISIFYDGFVLVEGNFSPNSTPKFIRDGEIIFWEDKYLNNLINNPSFESRIPYLKPDLSMKIWEYTRYIFSPNLIISSLFDLKNSGWYYTSTLRRLNNTFWATFGWGNVTLKKSLIPRPYLSLGIYSIIGITGYILSIFLHKKKLDNSQLKLIILLLASTSTIWLITFFRGITSLEGVIYIPNARYAYPAIIPTLYTFLKGWHFLSSKFDEKRNDVYTILVLIWFLILDISSILSILDFYH